jgi:hypothetical protein
MPAIAHSTVIMILEDALARAKSGRYSASLVFAVHGFTFSAVAGDGTPLFSLTLYYPPQKPLRYNALSEVTVIERLSICAALSHLQEGLTPDSSTADSTSSTQKKPNE